MSRAHSPRVCPQLHVNVGLRRHAPVRPPRVASCARPTSPQNALTINVTAAALSQGHGQRSRQCTTNGRTDLNEKERGAASEVVLRSSEPTGLTVVPNGRCSHRPGPPWHARGMVPRRTSHPRAHLTACGRATSPRTPPPTCPPSARLAWRHVPGQEAPLT